ncbi:MAG: phosphatase PAP2 family protein [Oscillospiraceae bacterium]|nr:phosphatase PAP2 family protein [Oscillospiraceae bacterium]
MKSKIIVSILLTALSLFIVLTVFVVTEHTALQTFNHTLYTHVAGQIHPTLTTMATWIGNLTHWYTYTPIILLLLLLPRTRMKAGLPMAITLPVSALLGPIILKNIFAIERPNVNQLIDPGGFGYPSGHAMNAMVFFGICAIMILRYSKSRPLKIGFTAFAVLSILLVGLSRVYLGVHTVTDVLGGYLAGGVVLCAAILIERHIRQKAAREGEVHYDQ